MRSNTPSPGTPASPPAPAPTPASHPAIGFLAALGFNIAVFLFAYSLWAEWGPYAWGMALQMFLFTSPANGLAFVLTFGIFCLPALLADATLRRHGRAMRLLAPGIPALALTAHLAVGVWFLWKGDAPDPHASFAGSVRTAGFLPRAIEFDITDIPPLADDQLTIVPRFSRRRSRASATRNGDYYIPFTQAAWPDANTPVYLTCRSTSAAKLKTEKLFTGNIRKSPFPYLVRRHWPSDFPPRGILIDIEESVRLFWIIRVFIDALLAVILVKIFYRR